MSRFARVTSIDVLETLAAAVQKFRAEAASAMDDLDIEMRRGLEWIHHDRKEYWAHELRRSEESVTQARIALQQARVARRVADHEPACVDEKRALERAKCRQETARRKVEAVRHWTHAVDHAVDECQRNRIQFLAWLQDDLVKAVAALSRMSTSLESYIQLEAPTADAARVLGPETSSAQGGEVSPKDPRSSGGSRTAAPALEGPNEVPRPAQAADPPPANAEPTIDRKEIGP